MENIQRYTVFTGAFIINAENNVIRENQDEFVYTCAQKKVRQI